ncbi:hypothetical protein P7C70_g2141, partial [Phenoliferia sp. Uapishka_3]
MARSLSSDPNLSPSPESSDTVVERAERSGDAEGSKEEREGSQLDKSKTEDDIKAKKLGARKKWFMWYAIVLFAFWVIGSWIFGTVYKDAEHVHHIHMTVADFDGGPVGKISLSPSVGTRMRELIHSGELGAALLAAVATYNGLPTYPTFHIVNTTSRTPTSLEHDAFIGNTWGTIYASEGASSRFAAAINQGATTSYDFKSADSAEVPPFEKSWESYLEPALVQIADTAAQLFANNTVTPILSNGAGWTVNQARVLLNPISATFHNLAPYPFGGRVFVNTVGSVFPVIFPFFGSSFSLLS